MSLKKEEYMPRLIDKKMEKYLKIFGAISIEGPKWCGKTWTALCHAESDSYMTNKEERELAIINPKYIFKDKRPQLIDEWQNVPSIWDAVRNECDKDHEKGKFILTGSTSLEKSEMEEEVFHSGTGRIETMQMFPMSLYEEGFSSGDVSISDMLNDCVKEKFVKDIELDEIAELIIRGGWPENKNISSEDAGIIPSSYIKSITKKDIHERKDRKRESKKMEMLIRSLARNESTIASYDRIVKDIEEYENQEELIESRQTVADYMSVLYDLYMLYDQEAFIINYRSSSRIGKTSKRHFVDPSLACAALNLNVDKLKYDLKTFGFMFEALVERDLKIYMDYLNGNLYHFRDNVSGDEVDAILEFEDGRYAAVEIKLSYDGIENAKKSLLNFYENVGSKKPSFMCIIVGYYKAIVKDKDTGIYMVPITALKP